MNKEWYSISFTLGPKHPLKDAVSDTETLKGGIKALYFWRAFISSLQTEEKGKGSEISLILYDTPENFKVGIERLNAMDNVDSIEHKPFDETGPRSLSFSFTPPAPSKHKVVIGGVIGSPQSGRLSFIQAITPTTKSSFPETTRYLFKHQFSNVYLPNGWNRSFTLVDTRGYYFDSDSKMDLDLLDLFVKGPVDLTNFSKNMDLKSIRLDEDNAPTHLVLTVPVRELYQGVSWLGSFFWSGSTKPHLDKLIVLYKAMRTSLANHQYRKEELISETKIGILITHMDMLRSEQKEEARRLIMSKLNRSGVSVSLVFFGEKECEWDENDLVAHEKKVGDFLKRVGKDEDYTDLLQAEEKPNHWLHIDEELYCKKKECRHRFTPKTQKGYLKLLMSFLAKE